MRTKILATAILSSAMMLGGAGIAAAAPQAPRALGGLCNSLGGQIAVIDNTTSVSYSCTGLQADMSKDSVVDRRANAQAYCFDVIRPESGASSVSFSSNFTTVDGVFFLTRFSCTVSGF